MNKMWCSNPNCKSSFEINPTCAMPQFCANCGGSSFQSWEPGTYPFLLAAAPAPMPVWFEVKVSA